MPTDKASYRAKDTGDTIPFRPTNHPENYHDGYTEGPEQVVPKVWPDGSFTNKDITAVAPKQFYVAKGHDTYTGIPGDGIVGGNEGSAHEKREAIIATKKYVKGNSPAGRNAPGVGGGGGPGD
jgi:hypothetical protein